MSIGRVPEVMATATAVITPSVAVAAAAGKAAAPADDRELVRRAQAEDQGAFEELVRRHQHRVVAVAGGILRQREDVEDIAQQVFVKAYFSLNRFDQRAAFSTWLYKIAVNECWDHLRKKKVRPLLYESDLSEEQVSQLDGIATMGRAVDGLDEQAETRDTLQRVL